MDTRAIQPRYPTAAAIAQLTAILNLPPCCQDWEIEVADPDRVGEFLDVYERQPLDDDGKFALMALIVASYDELLAEHSNETRYRERIRRHLLDQFDLHAYTVQYWSLPDDEDTAAARDGWSFTPFARELMAAVYGPREHWPRRPFVVKRFIDWPEPVVAGVALNVMQISDESDGHYQLWWSKYGERSAGKCEFPTVDEAIEYATRTFEIPPDRWTDV